jgi:hypothetical protein
MAACGKKLEQTVFNNMGFPKSWGYP